jgi:glycosyltransferase involved in cell wall biosynthesis
MRAPVTVRAPAPPRPADVLYDLTPMNTPSRLRGIGRYAYELGRALGNLGNRDLAIAGLVRTEGEVRIALTFNLDYPGTPHRDPILLSEYQSARRWRLASLVHRSGCKLLHLSDPHGTPLGLRVPKVVTCHDVIPLVMSDDYLGRWRPDRRVHERLKNLMRYRTARRVIAISEATRRDLVEHVGVAEDRIDVVHHGVDHSRFNPEAAPGEEAKVRAFLRTERPYLLAIGASDRRKNLELMTRAFFATGRQRDVDLVITGVLHNRASVLETIANRAGARTALRLTGYVDDALIPMLYRQSLAHVFPTLYEGFGFPALEAMACGVPTITTPGSSLAEVVGDAALLFDGHDESDLADKLGRVIDDTDLRERLRRRGREVALTFTWERCAAETVAVYRRALAEGA